MDSTHVHPHQRVSATHPPNAAALMQQGQRLAGDTMQLLDSTARTARAARAWGANVFEKNPYLVLGGAAAVGYIVAGGLSSRLTRVALRNGARIMLAQVIDVLYATVTGAEPGGET